jgi:two-component system cell cycle sensor histidine kinase/response regulator CckA
MTREFLVPSSATGDLRSRPPEAIPAQLIYEAAFDAMWVMRVDPGDRFVIISINPAYTALTGVRAEAMVGKTPADLLQEDDLKHVLDRHREAVRNRRPVQYEESIVVGRRITVETTLTPVFEASGKCSHILGCTRDISSRKASELALASLQAQLREARSSHAIGMLATGIASEFRNTLEVIQGHLDGARRDARRSAKVLKSLAASSKACRHAQEISKQILAFSATSSDGRRVVDLAKLVREASQMAQTTARHAHALRYSDAGSAARVSVDWLQFQQAVISLLLITSRSLGEADGEVTVHVDTVSVAGPDIGASSGPRQTTFARIAIEAKASAVGPAHRVTSALADVANPAVADPAAGDMDFPRHVIGAHQGATVAAVDADGAISVTVYLPVASARDGEAELAAAGDSLATKGGLTRSRVNGRIIMYVDDHKWLLPLAERLLADQGFEVRGFFDPEAALEALHKHAGDYGLVATDYKMSKITGLDIARAAKAARPDIPVVMISAYLSDALKAQALRAGADVVIHKSSLLTDLLPTITRLMPPPSAAGAPPQPAQRP